MKLWHDDIRKPPDDSWVWVRTNKQAKEILLSEEIEECSLDHDMGLHDYDPDEPDADIRIAPDKWKYEDGMDLVKWMVENKLVPNRVTIHSWNPPGASNMANYLLRYSDVSKVIVKPFDLSVRG